jgi:hypothetical protein
MTSTFRPRATRDSDPVIRWVFQRDAKTITCEVDALSADSYDVCLVPHWDVSSSMAPRLDAPADALLRHAQIASQLRDRGWVLVDRVASGRLAAA